MADTVMDGFAGLLRAQIAATRSRLEAARAGRDYPGIRSVGLRLRYLLEMAQDRGIDPDRGAIGPGRADESDPRPVGTCGR